MRILVTGAAGFAGQHLLAELRRDGEHEITAGTLDLQGNLPTASGAGVRWVELDIGVQESVNDAIRESRPDQVYHLAGQASVGESFRRPLATWEVNATGTLRVLEGLRAAGLSGSRLLLASSCEVYGAVPEAEQPITEAHPYRPVTPYGASKAGAEMLALQYTLSRAVEVVVARSFNHIGPGQDERFVLPSFARQLTQIRNGAAPPVLHVGNLDVRRDFLDVRDAVRGYVTIMKLGTRGLAYNVCSEQPRSLEEVVKRLVELSGTAARLVVDPERVRPLDIPSLAGASTRLRALGWSPVIPLDTTLGDLLREAEAGVQTDG